MSKHGEPSGWVETLIAGLTDWVGMAKFVKAFGDPLAAAVSIICVVFIVFSMVVAVGVIWADHRDSEGRRQERQEKRRLSHERYMAAMDRQTKHRQGR